MTLTGTKAEVVILQLMRRKAWRLAIAESCTGGLIAHRFTNLPGASEVLIEGFVTYTNQAKIKRLRIPRKTIQEYGGVSSQTAEAMARGATSVSGCEVSLAVTGVAGPNSIEGKPVGLVYVAWQIPGLPTESQELTFKGERIMIKAQAAEAAAKTLLEKLR